MQAPEFLLAVLDRLQHTLDLAVDGLTDEDLAYRPDPKVNPIGFMLWHMSREEDYVISDFEERGQVWIAQGWHEKFGKPADPEYTGYGFSPEEAGEFEIPDLKTVMDYKAAVRKETVRFFQGCTDRDFDRKMKREVAGYKTMGGQLTLLTSEIIQHTGQIAYLRGIRTEYGWHPGWQ